MFEGKVGQALGALGLACGWCGGRGDGGSGAPQGARRLAVLATCGVLSIADEVKNASAGMKKVATEARGELNKLVEEAQDGEHGRTHAHLIFDWSPCSDLQTEELLFLYPPGAHGDGC